MRWKNFVRASVACLLFAGAAPCGHGTVTIQFNYTFDTNQFFTSHPEAVTVLQKAAQFFDGLLNDSLSAIDAATQSDLDHRTDTWQASIFNPSDPNDSFADVNVTNLVVPADTLIVYVGGATLGEGILGLGGPADLSITGSTAWKNIVNGRGQAGALGPATGQTDYGPWGGVISFDDTTPWYYDLDPSTTKDIPRDEYDFYSVALHELGHILGIGTAFSWDNLVQGGVRFTGPAATLVNHGVGPTLNAGIDHWSPGLKSTIFGTNTMQEVAMDPDIGSGVRKYFTTLDVAALKDIGWEVVDPTTTTAPGNVAAVAGKPAVFNVVAKGTSPLSYQWQVSTDGGGNYANITNAKGVSGATAATLTLTTTAGSSLGTGNLYRCVVTSPFGPNFSSAASLTVNVPPLITTQPANAMVIAGQNASFTLGVAGASTSPLSYQWKKNNANIPGATNATYTIDSAAAADAAKYTVVVSNAGGKATSAIATLTLAFPPAITKQAADAKIVAGKPASFAVTATGTTPLAYQWQVSTDAGASFGNLTDGGGVKGSLTAKLALTTTANTTTGNGNIYRCLVTNAVGNATSNPVNLAVGTLPKITASPVPATALLGTPANFTVAATGSGALAYQWQGSIKGTTWTNLADDGNITNSTTATLTLNATAAGFYRCVVTNAIGTATSAKSALVVTFPPGGIYFGTFTGKNGAGKFASLVQSNNDTLILGFNTTHKTGFAIPAFTLAANGTFTTSDGDSPITGAYTSTVMNATAVAPGGAITLKGTHKANTGAQSAHAGYYTGAYSGGVSGTLTALLASDGALLVYSVSNSPDDEGDGGQGTIAKTNKFTLTTANGTKLTGTLNPDADEIIGTYKSKSGQTGTFELTLDLSP